MSVQEENFLKKVGFVPRISFKATPIVREVKILAREEQTIKDNDGQEKPGIRYTVDVKGEEKSFFTSSPDLVSKLSAIKDGEAVDIQLKSVKNPANGKFISKFIVKKSSGVEEETVEEEEYDPEFGDNPL